MKYAVEMTKCLDCEMESVCRGYCHRHYMAARLDGRLQRKTKRHVVRPNDGRRGSNPGRLARIKIGFTDEVVTELRSSQQGRCAICPREMQLSNKKAMDGEQADHCHVTGKVRGLLCAACNRSLGFYEKWQRPAGLVLAPYEAYLAR